jgi:hypothetical protein
MGIFSVFGIGKISDRVSDLLEGVTYNAGNVSQSAVYTLGNATNVASSCSSVISSCCFYAQLGLAGVGLAQCVTSAIDSSTCINPISKPLYLIASITGGLGAVSSLGCSIASWVAPPLAPVFITTGLAFRFGAKYATKLAVATNPCPSFSEVI